MAAPSNSLANALSAPWLAGKSNPSGAKKGNSLANALSGPWLTSKSGPSGTNSGVKTYVDNIFSPTARQNVSTSPTGQPSGTPYGGGGGDGGGYSAPAGPSDEQKKAFDNLGAITGYNKGTLENKYADTMDMLDVSDQQNKNLRDTQKTQAKRKAGSEWFSQHKKLQDTVSQMTDAAGGALRGSFLLDYADLLGDQDDTIDESVLRSLRENINSVDNSYFESLAQNINNRNEAAINTEEGLRELIADYMAQGNNIHPDLIQKYLDTSGHTIKTGDLGWLKTDGFYDGHKKGPAKPDDFSFIRPDRANKGAADLQTGDSNTSQSVAGDYWQRMASGYNQRKRQA